jgi:hypothetical protein
MISYALAKQMMTHERSDYDSDPEDVPVATTSHEEM